MKNNQLKIVGRFSKKNLTEYASIFSPEIYRTKKRVILFCDYSLFNIPIGHQFSCLEDIKRAVIVNNLEIELKIVTQQMKVVFSEIPEGWKTICLFEFLTQVPEMIYQLPEVDDWYDSDQSLLMY